MKKLPLLTSLMLLMSQPADAGPLFDSLPDEKQMFIQTLIRDHFPDSTLSRDEQAEELAWFAHAAAYLRGTGIWVLSEQLPTNDYEARVLALSDYMEGAGKAFTLPTLALEDFIGLEFITGPDGKI